MTAAGRLYHLALRETHAAAGARFSPRLGWSLPADYGDARAEHGAIRERCAIVDRSHRSRFVVTGTDAHEVLARTFAGRAGEVEEGRALRTVALSAEGMIRDVVLIARTGGIAYIVSGEPTQRFETFARLEAARDPAFDARVDDRTESTCQVGLVGPSASETARQHLAEAAPARLQLLHCVAFEFHGFRALALRTSDTGEDGFDFVFAPAVAQHAIETLRVAGVPLAGDVAQECARVEACIPAFDPDLATGLTPAQAGLDTLLGIPGGPGGRLLAAMLVEGGVAPPAGAPLLADGERVGEVRSALYSFALGSVIALGVVDQHAASPGTPLDADGIRATIVSKPFFRHRGH